MFDFGEFRVRPATMTDAENLLRIKNDPQTRINSIVAKDEIRFEDHLVWLKDRIGSKHVKLFVIVKRGNFVGDVRFDLYRKQKQAEVSVRISAEHRGQGIGSFIVSRMCDVIQRRHKGFKLTAKIVDGNLPSLMVFLKSGFQFDSHALKVIHLYRP